MKKLSELYEYKIPINTLFYIAYFLIIASDIFDNILIFKNLLIVVDIISILLLILVIVIKRKIEIKMLIFLVLIGVSTIVSDDRSLLKLPFLLMAFNGIEFKDFIKKDLIFRVTLVGILFIFNFIGITNNGVLEVRNGFMRNSFGLGHPNSFAFYLTVICLDFYYIENQKEKSNIVKPLIISMCIVAFIFLFVGSRTNILIISLFSLLFLLERKIKIKIKNRSIIPYIFAICMIISIAFAYGYNSNNEILNLIDKLLSRRLYLANYFVTKYDITLFGNNVITSQFYALDNAYINIFVRYGVTLAVYFVIMFRNTTKNLIEKKEYVLAIILTIFAIYGISETPLYIPAKNPYILLLVFSWSNSKVKLLSKRRSIDNE